MHPTTLPACTLEDGSAPGQAFPCYWDATAGNAHGDSFTMTAPETYLYDDGTLLTPQTQTHALLTVSPQPADQLAHTGVDPLGWVVAAVLMVAGISLVKVGRTHSH